MRKVLFDVTMQPKRYRRKGPITKAILMRSPYRQFWLFPGLFKLGDTTETQNVTERNLAESGKKSQETLESIIGHCINKQSDSLIPIT